MVERQCCVQSSEGGQVAAVAQIILASYISTRHLPLRKLVFILSTHPPTSPSKSFVPSFDESMRSIIDGIPLSFILILHVNFFFEIVGSGRLTLRQLGATLSKATWKATVIRQLQYCSLESSYRERSSIGENSRARHHHRDTIHFLLALEASGSRLIGESFATTSKFTFCQCSSHQPSWLRQVFVSNLIFNAPRILALLLNLFCSLPQEFGSGGTCRVGLSRDVNGPMFQPHPLHHNVLLRCLRVVSIEASCSERESLPHLLPFRGLEISNMPRHERMPWIRASISIYVANRIRGLHQCLEKLPRNSLIMLKY
jgi:hypothetical protein